jgi:hypothetical protein
MPGSGMPPLYFVIRPSSLAQDYVMAVDPYDHPGEVVLSHVSINTDPKVPFPYSLNPDEAQLWRLVYVPTLMGFAIINKLTRTAATANGRGQVISLTPLNALSGTSVWSLGGANIYGPTAVRPADDDGQNINVSEAVVAQNVPLITWRWGGGDPNEVWDFLPIIIDADDDPDELAFFSILYSKLGSGVTWCGMQDLGLPYSSIVTANINIAEHIYPDGELFALMFWPAWNGLALVNKASGNAVGYAGAQGVPLTSTKFVTYDANGYGACQGGRDTAWMLLSAPFLFQGRLASVGDLHQGINILGGNTTPGRPISTWGDRGANSSWTLQSVPYWDESNVPPPTLDQLNQIITKYSPIYVTDVNETYLPCSVDWFLQRAVLLQQQFKQRYFDEWQLTNGHLQKTFDRHNPPPSNYYWLKIPETAYPGDPSTTTNYVYVKDYGRGFIDIQYWIFCAYNGAAFARLSMPFSEKDFDLQPLGRHTGDWEHATVRVSYSGDHLIAVYCSQHSGGTIVMPAQVQMQGTHPVIYSSLHGHAMAATAGAQLYERKAYFVAKFGLINYYDNGRRFDMSQAPVLLLGANNIGPSGITGPMYSGLAAAPSWLDFPCDWGPTELNLTPPDSTIEAMVHFFTGLAKSPASWIRGIISDLTRDQSGPSGPKFKDSWSQDDEFV